MARRVEPPAEVAEPAVEVVEDAAASTEESVDWRARAEAAERDRAELVARVQALGDLDELEALRAAAARTEELERIVRENAEQVAQERRDEAFQRVFDEADLPAGLRPVVAAQLAEDGVDPLEMDGDAVAAGVREWMRQNRIVSSSAAEHEARFAERVAATEAAERLRQMSVPVGAQVIPSYQLEGMPAQEKFRLMAENRVAYPPAVARAIQAEREASGGPGWWEP